MVKFGGGNYLVETNIITGKIDNLLYQNENRSPKAPILLALILYQILYQILSFHRYRLPVQRFFFFIFFLF